MKKFLLLAAMIAATTAAYALSFTVDNINYTTVFDYHGCNNEDVGGVLNGVAVTSSPNASGVLDFSNRVYYDGVHYDVTCINRYAFQNNKNITGLIAGDKLNKFGEYCFQGTNLQGTLQLDANGLEIWQNAFEGTQIDKLVINGSSTYGFGAYSFADCPNLSDVEFNGDCSFLDYAFSGDTKLTTLRWPSGSKATKVNASYFKGMSLTTLILPSTVTKIGGIGNIPLENLIIEGDEEPLEISGPIESTAGDFTITINRATPPTFTNFGKTIQYVMPNREVTYNTEYFFPVKPAVILEGAAADNAAAYQEAQGWSEFADQITTGVYNIAIEPVEAIEAPVYYNLNGMRVSADALTPGVYVKVLGNQATKILVH